MCSFARGRACAALDVHADRAAAVISFVSVVFYDIGSFVRVDPSAGTTETGASRGKVEGGGGASADVGAAGGRVGRVAIEEAKARLSTFPRVRVLLNEMLHARMVEVRAVGDLAAEGGITMRCAAPAAIGLCHRAVGRCGARRERRRCRHAQYCRDGDGRVSIPRLCASVPCSLASDRSRCLRGARVGTASVLWRRTGRLCGLSRRRAVARGAGVAFVQRTNGRVGDIG